MNAIVTPQPDPKKNGSKAELPEKLPTTRSRVAMDLYDAYALGAADLEWAHYMVGDLKDKFFELRECMQKNYHIHEIHFEKLTAFFKMYEFFLEERQRCHQEIAEEYSEESKQSPSQLLGRS